MSIGERISTLRKEAGLSQGQLAAALDISRQAVSKWENDQAAPDSINLIRLSDILDTDIEYLATGRRSYGRRPPVVIKSVETIEKVVEKPVVEVVEKIVEKVVETPVIQYVDHPVTRKVIRIQYRNQPFVLFMVGVVCFFIGFLVGICIR